jgi:hypothetical protein
MMMDNIQKRKKEIIQVLFEGIRNPVVASALHQHCNPYLTVISFILNAMEKPESRELRKDTESEEQRVMLGHVIEWIQIQVKNMKKLLGADDQILQNVDFAEISDIKPIYCKTLEMFETNPLIGQERVKEF